MQDQIQHQFVLLPVPPCVGRRLWELPVISIGAEHPHSESALLHTILHTHLKFNTCVLPWLYLWVLCKPPHSQTIVQDCIGRTNNFLCWNTKHTCPKNWDNTSMVISLKPLHMIIPSTWGVCVDKKRTITCCPWCLVWIKNLQTFSGTSLPICSQLASGFLHQLWSVCSTFLARSAAMFKCMIPLARAYTFLCIGAKHTHTNYPVLSATVKCVCIWRKGQRVSGKPWQRLSRKTLVYY